jgi:uncharacterized membrane protein YebE (DUF533 family)
MFDARSLLEQIVNGANRGSAPGQQSGGGGIGDILGDLMRNAGGQGGPARNATPGAQADAPQGGGGLSDILGDLLGGGNRPAGAPAGGQAGGNPLEDLLRNLTQGQGQPQSRNVAPGAQPAGGADGGGGLADILGKLQQNLGSGQGGGSITEILGNILSQATQGAKEGAGRVSDATGAGTAARDALNRTTGRTPEDLMAQLKELIANNRLGAGAAAGTLGGLVLGTQTGRGLAMSAAKIGALALIGGLAYKAYQNYQAGRPLITGAHPAEVAPQGSGFEPQALTNQSATTYIRAMIAAANADGRIDEAEKQKIFGALKQGGLEAEAEAFLQHELSMPASVDELAAAVGSAEEAAQVYTAARIAIEPDTAGENAFLTALASRLGIDRDLAAFIDNEARTTSA